MARPLGSARGVLVLVTALWASGCLFPDYRVEGQAASAGGQPGTGGTGGSGAGGTGGLPSVDASVGGTSAGGATTDASAEGGATDGASGGGGVAGSGGTSAMGGTTATGGTSTTGGSSSTGGVTSTSDAAAGGGSAGAADAGSSGGTSADAVVPENCVNGVDDDKDNATDCNDSDCATNGACAGLCTSAGPLSCGTALLGQRTDGVGSTSRIGPPSYSCASGTYAGPERAHLLSVPAGQTVFLEAYGFDADVGLFLVSVNSGLACHADLACSVSSDVAGLDPEAVSFTAGTNRDYYVIVDGAAPGAYSLIAQCAPTTSCHPTRAIRAGQTVTGSTATSEPNVTTAVTTYSCQGANHGGSEAAFLFTPEVTGSYRVDLTNLSTNLSLFVEAGPSCNATCLSASSYSVSASTTPESVTFTGVAGTTYYFVAESFNATVGTFSLSVTAL